MNAVTRLLINKSAIAETRIEISSQVTLSAGQSRMRIERVGLTANNISYAAAGDKLQYWQFFPATDPWGCVPAWGFATVAESQVDGLAVGERIWGFWPMASELVIEPVKLTAAGFSDGIAHRRKLPFIYNEYQRCAVDPMHHAGQEDAEAILRPMFSTSWLVEDFIFDNGFFGANTMVISSASSKTAYGTAYQLRKRGATKVIGLTAARNQSFVEALGCYDQVLTYDDIEQLDAQAACVYLDYAGSVDIRRRVHQQLQNLLYSSMIGGSHVDQMGSSSGLPGPKPVFLFIPSHAFKRVGEWGLNGLMERMGSDWRTFVNRALDPSDPWLIVHHHEGPDAVKDAFQLVLSGAADARSGHMLLL
jgi:hypothetical protein